jgi:hypothetical protein
MQFEASRQRFYNIEEMLEFADDDGSEQWLVHNIIPKVGRTIIFGEGAVFKTFFIFDLAVAVASGGLLFRKLKIGAHGPVMVISTESSKYANARRIISHIRAREAYCAEKAIRERPIVPNTAELPLFYCQQPFDLDNMQDVTSLNQSIMDVEKTCGKPPAMIILDPLDSFMSGDENSAKETRPMRRTLDAIVEAYNTSVVIIHHANKKSEMRGSSSLKGWTDAQIQFTRREAPVVGGRKSTVVDVFVHKQRDGISQVPGFTFHPEIATARGITTFSIIGPDEDQEEVARNTISSEVYNYLNENGPTLQTQSWWRNSSSLGSRSPTRSTSWWPTGRWIVKGKCFDPRMRKAPDTEVSELGS